MNKTGTVQAVVSYSRQHQKTKDHTVKLLTLLEKQHGLKNLSVMRDPEEILRRLYEANVRPVIDENKNKEFFHVF